MTTLKKWLALLLAVMLVFSLAACGGEDSSDPDKTDAADASQDSGTQDSSGGAKDSDTSGTNAPESSGGTIAGSHVTIGYTNQACFGHFDPLGVYSDSINNVVDTCCYDRLLYNDPETGALTSVVLADYGWETDTLYYFTLRDDVFFSNGDQMLAEDILYTLSTAPDSKNAPNYSTVDWDNCYVSDDNLTCYIAFQSPFPAIGSIFKVGILNKSFIDENGGFDAIDWYDTDSICGSGPYEVLEYEYEMKTVVTRRDGWWYEAEAPANMAQVETIEVVYYSDNTTMMVDYETGVIDLAVDITSADADRIGADPSLGHYELINSDSVCTLVFGVETNPILENAKLREAICYAIDTSVLGNIRYGSFATECQGIFPNTGNYADYYQTGYVYEYDPEYAKQCLAESGLTDVTLSMIVVSTDADIAESLQYYLEQVGITLEVQAYELMTTLQYWFEGQTDLILINNNSANSVGDPSITWKELGPGGSFPTAARNADEVFIEAIAAGKSTVDPAERVKIYQDLQQYAYDTFQFAPICEWSSGVACGPAIASSGLTSAAEADFRFITLN